MKHTVLVTGAAGYVGAMLVRRFAARPDVERVLGVDKEPCPELLRELTNYTHFTTNTADDWEGKVREYRPDIAVHAAWQIRELYGAQDLEWQWNIVGSDKIFDYALDPGSGVTRLVYFSTVASYGAFADNSPEHRFTEDEPLRKTDYRYAEEKRVAEEHLKAKYEKSDKRCAVAIVRPAAITGPRGRFMRVRFGLQSILAGQMRGGIYGVVSALVAFVPVTQKWLRQFVHEDDVVNIVELLAFKDIGCPTSEVGHPMSKLGCYQVFNLCPPGPAVFGKDMASAVGKRVLPVSPLMVRAAFAFFWHATRGLVPTGRGAWKSYSYPIAVDGSKVTRVLGYGYKHQGLDAFRYTDGEYETFVPEDARRSRSA